MRELWTIGPVQLERTLEQIQNMRELRTIVPPVQLKRRLEQMENMQELWMIVLVQLERRLE